MSALQWIVKEAKSLKKSYPKRFTKWTDYVKQASAIYASKHGGKSPVGKKKTVKKVAVKKAAKKIGYSKTRLKQEKGITKALKQQPRTLFPYTDEEKIIHAGKKYFDERVKQSSHKAITGTKKKVLHSPLKKKAVKKPSEQSILNKIHKVKHDVEKLDESQHKHMSGIEDKMFKDLYDTRERIANTKKAILKLQTFAKVSPTQKHIFQNKAKQYKKYLIELNTHYRELKKHI